ncbi:apiosidase-like domain-containing protein [Cyclobacterium qasimii]|uniref:DUF4038 domain-containing protein n=2 Tax=Cyclobacterium qasimii TaxID=1350429 RepID=S7V8N1_9BACT|nr:DUF4038 domain-containing protein [Cyclobacterium qasimii]EPR66216.1 hypothetical protein ADICYQ_4914 [Cyclobacterium qasimii M12-11B]GEO21313.1 hypothetical protein CQA01_18470 [Cyclobacterium qasimii]
MKTNLSALKIGENGRYLTYQNGDPFFWLGDTAWELIHRLTLAETQIYFQNRVDKGFTIIQTVILAELDGLTVPNANGDLPLKDLDPCQPNEAYFSHLDQVIALAKEMGLYLALLPTWGDKFNKKWGTGPEVFTPENAKVFGSDLAKRYAKHQHIVWVLGGDRVPQDKEDEAIIEQMAVGIREFDKDSLLTYHPNGGVIASDIFGKSSWLQVDMFQSRHQKNFREYTVVNKARRRQPLRPVINGEPGYENIPNLLNKWNFQRLDASDIRLSAYWSMLSGAAGYTYGCNEVWQMHAANTTPLFGAHLSWQEALDLPGARQMKILRQVFESLPWQQMLTSGKIFSGINWPLTQKKMALTTADQSCILVYQPTGSKIKLNLNKAILKDTSAYWINPHDGEVIAIEGRPSNTFQTPNRLQDWLLLILSQSQKELWQYPRS